MKRKGKTRDPRINIRHQWLKNSLALFLVLLVVNGAHIMIYQAVFGIEPTLENLLVPELVSFLFFATFILCIVMNAGRYFTYNRPIQAMGNAAKQIAEGDFSVRMPTRRGRGGRKDYLDVLYEDFNTMAEELSSIETLKGDFIANVSHEIKTPLSVIQSYAAALQNDALPPAERKEYSATIVSASQRLSALVTNILKLNKLENQEISPVSKPYDLSEQLRCCALAFEELWEKKGLQFSADIQDDVTVTLDESMMEIVWNNLISNAIKFTEPGGSITIGLREEDGFAVVAVSDSGCGMDEATGKHIFDQFYQGDTSHAQEGNGLGLSLVLKVIEILGGEITVDSQLGEGTTFTLRVRAE